MKTVSWHLQAFAWGCLILGILLVPIASILALIHYAPVWGTVTVLGCGLAHMFGVSFMTNYGKK
jgi:hypothetical protein